MSKKRTRWTMCSGESSCLSLPEYTRALPVLNHTGCFAERAAFRDAATETNLLRGCMRGEHVQHVLISYSCIPQSYRGAD